MKRILSLITGLYVLMLSSGALAQTITIGTLTPASPFCSGATPGISFTVAGFAGPETYNVQLSDAVGNFGAPTVVGSSSGSNGVYNPTLTLPSVVTTSAAYKIRVVSSVTNVISGLLTNVAITAPVGNPAFSLGATSSRCQGNGNITYTATASDATNLTYALDATSLGAGNTIVSGTGKVNYTNGYSGTATITVTATGCGPSTNASHVVTINPTIGLLSFTLGASSNRCQGAGVVSYVAASSNASLSFSLDPISSGAGNSINPASGDVTYVSGWTGTSTISVTATGCGGPLNANHSATTNATIGAPAFVDGATSTRCQGAGNVAYAASSANGGAIVFSLDPASSGAGNSINPADGTVTYTSGWSGTTTITATASGCGGPLVSTHTVTVTPTVANPTFTLGASSIRCQGAGTVNYGATAANNSSLLFELDAASLLAGNSINATNGDVTYTAGWSGNSSIKVTAGGCGGPKIANHSVTITPSVTTPVFALGVSSSRCQGAGNVTYTASASNTTGITYSLDAVSLTAGNSINSNTGQVTYVAGWAGTSVITASAAGCNGPLTATHTVSTVGNPVFTLGPTSSRCPGFATITYTATSINNTGLTYSFTNTGASVTNSSNGQIIYDPAVTGTVTITVSAAGCTVPLTAVHTVTVNPPVGIPAFNAPNLTPCQGSTVTYNASATAASSIAYSIATNPIGQATIGSSSGVATFNPSFVGTAVVTATASGCVGPTSSSINLVITPVVTTPIFNAGPLSVVCQNPGTITYAATANNATAIAYSVTPGGAGTISTTTGALAYNAGFSGVATITAVATGCNGTSSNTFPVTVTPNVGLPSFGALGATSTRKQGAAVVTYAATATNTSGITYALSPAGAGNIVPGTGAVTWNAGFSGTATITATAAGCAGPTTAVHTVTVVQTPVFTLGASSVRCQNSGNVAYGATTPNTPSAVITYTVATSPSTGTVTINSTNGTVTYPSTFSGTVTVKASATQNSVTTDEAVHTVTVNVAPRLTAPTPTSKTICSGDSTKISLVATTGAGSGFAWTLAGGTNITGKATGIVNVIDQQLVNTSSSVPDSLWYIVTVTSPASCLSVVLDSIKVRVNPKPVLNAIAPTTICSESSINISLGATAASNFSWTVSAPTKITNVAPGSGSIINQTLNNTDVSASPTSGTATYTITPVSLLGCTGNPGTASVTVNPLPVTSVTGGNSKTICSGSLTALPLTANLSSNFAFTTATITSLGLVSGNSNGSGSTINQTLTNSSNLVADSISYSIVATTNVGLTCVGKPTTVVVRVNPNPAMTTAATSRICSGTPDTTTLSATLPSTFSWTIGTVTGGITGQTPNATSVAVSKIGQTLNNPSFVNVGTVEYVVTPTTVSLPNCVGVPKSYTLQVNPLPKLVSDTERTICSGDILNYTPASSVTAGTTIFMYDRTSAIPTIANQFQKTTTGISDTLFSNFILTPAIVDYNFVLTSAAFCKLDNQHLRVTVNPRPDTPGISVFPRTKLCSGASNMNFSSSRTPDATEFFKWSATGGTTHQKPDSSFSQNSLISFSGAGSATVSVVSNVRGFGCVSQPSIKTLNVSTALGNQGINVVLFANNLVAQVSNAKAYQWGFDRKSDLDSTLLSGETTQNYDTRKGFRTNDNYYWVMVTFNDDCVQKAYFNGPVLGVEPKTSGAAELKVYPNPAADQVTVEVVAPGGSSLTYEMYDLAGRRVKTATSAGVKTRMSVAELAPGYYTIICLQDGIRIASSRFVKN